MTKLNKFLLLTAFTLSGVASVSHADDYGNSHMSTTVVHDVQFAPFKPQAKTSNASLDYKMLDAALENTVFRMGLSARRHMSRPDPLLGSRITSGHTSPYRLEGSRVMFSFLTDSYIDQITEYRADLEGIANRVDISTLDRKEQLAFWFNLHNIVVIEQIAYKYPTTYPHKIKIDGVPLDEAKIIDIRGVKMSLRDIREKIVYPNWESPLVIYGFFRGDIGSPALQNYAYTGDNVSWVLNTQAAEFVNSLRGFHKTTSNRKVSTLYDEAKPFFFPQWEQDLTAHLLKFAREEVAEEIGTPLPYSIDRYDYTIADMMAGDRIRVASAATWTVNSATGQMNNAGMPPEMRRLLEEVTEKANTLRQRDLGRSGTVIIEDIIKEEVE